jgi:hypothetical protein
MAATDGGALIQVIHGSLAFLHTTQERRERQGIISVLETLLGLSVTWLCWNSCVLSPGHSSNHADAFSCWCKEAYAQAAVFHSPQGSACLLSAAGHRHQCSHQGRP